MYFIFEYSIVGHQAFKSMSIFYLFDYYIIDHVFESPRSHSRDFLFPLKMVCKHIFSTLTIFLSTIILLGSFGNVAMLNNGFAFVINLNPTILPA
jgi:hypothetical protein